MNNIKPFWPFVNYWTASWVNKAGTQGSFHHFSTWIFESPFHKVNEWLQRREKQDPDGTIKEIRLIK